MAYNGVKQIVIDTATNEVLRYGYCDMANDGIFDAATETIVENGHRFDSRVAEFEWSWNGSVFSKGNAKILEGASKIQQVDVNKEVNKNSYTKVSRIVYNGKKTGVIREIEAVCYAGNSNVTYDLRVVDRKNGGEVIAEATGFNNTEPDIVVLTNLESLGNRKTVLEIQIRRSGSSGWAYLDSLLLKY